jgi:hypothetical protein
MIVYLFDPRWPDKQYYTPHPVSPSVVKWICFEDVSVRDMLTAMKTRRDIKPGMIQLMRVCAHGNTGYVELGQGLTQTGAGAFDVLKGCFAPRADGIEIHACGVASDTDILKNGTKHTCVAGTYSPNGVGYNFLKALAEAAGAPVRAAINCQQADRPFNYEGQTMTVRPDGSSVTGGG